MFSGYKKSGHFLHIMVILGGFFAKIAPSRVNFLKFLPKIFHFADFLKNFFKMFFRKQAVNSEYDTFCLLILVL